MKMKFKPLKSGIKNAIISLNHYACSLWLSNDISRVSIRPSNTNENNVILNGF